MKKSNKLLLVINLGSPKSAEPNDVGDFLNEFLMDPLVINIPKPLRWLLVKKLIVPKRKFNSAEAYQAIWMSKGGSPLVFHTKRFVDSLANELGDFKVDYAMRYNGPSISDVLDKYKDYSEIYVLPIYPQYAESSTETVLVEVKRYFEKLSDKTKVFKIDYFYKSEAYLESMSEHISKHLAGKDIQHLLFSYHGLPENHIQKLGAEYKRNCLKKDCCPQRFGTEHLCYRSQCFETTKLIVEKLNLNNISVSTSFQSRLGKAEWVKPYTVDHLDDLVKNKSIDKLAIVSPSFIADCLETLEEIEMQLKEQFDELGGKDFYYIPALNDSSPWVKRFSTWIEGTHEQWVSI